MTVATSKILILLQVIQPFPWKVTISPPRSAVSVSSLGRNSWKWLLVATCEEA